MSSSDEPDRPKTTYDVLYRLVLIGDSGVGKTAILVRYSDNLFNTSFITTIGIDFRIKTIDRNGKRVKLQIWDTAGQEQFHSVASSYYRNAHGIMLIYDVTRAQSFIHISKWVNNISANAPTTVKQILIGNKCDMEANQRVIEKDRGNILAQELDMPFVETSAKTNTNIDGAFEVLTDLIMDGHTEKEDPDDTVKLENATKKKHKCCQSRSM